MRTAIKLAAGVLAALAAGAAFFLSGMYNIAATEQHTAPVYYLLEAGMRQSVRAYASGIVAPALDDPPRAVRGRALYDEHCARCHGAPGVAPEPFALGMTPTPGNLAFTAREWPPEQLFWTIKHGIKMTGMPAWQFRLDDDDLWSIVAHLRVLARQSPREYRAGVQQGATPALSTATNAPAPQRDVRRGIVALRQYGCATCHRIPGVVGADAPVAPPLADMATRTFIAGVVANDRADLIRWLRSPQSLNADSAMPDLGVTERDAADMVAYLYSLK